MKKLHLFPLLGISLLFSCNGGEEKTDKTSSSDSSANTATTAITQSTVDTTPATVLIVRHKVADYAKWKMAYDGHDSARLANGIHNYIIGRGVEDSNMVLVATKADAVEKAKAFIKDPSLKTAMQKGGVVGAPTISIITTAYTDNSPNLSDLRSMTDFMVKDWNTWKSVFESNRQTRLDNGITDRAYGHDPDNDKKVLLVTAISDTAKAMAFWKSDLLKKQRADAGVIGEPKRFIYRVVQKYQ